MKSRITKLADLNGFVIGEEYRDTYVSEEAVQEILVRMADNLGEDLRTDCVEGNCLVHCLRPDGTVLPVYPALEIPGTEACAAALQGKKPGDTIVTEFLGQEVTLIVSEILKRISAPLDDRMAIRASIEGVASLSGLKGYIREQEIAKKRNAAVKALASAMMEYLERESESAIDEEEQILWAKTHAVTAYQENMAAGIDLRFTPEGDMLTEEEAVAMLEEDMKQQFRMKLVVDCCCREWNHVPDPAEFMAMLPPETMGIEGMEPDEELIEQLKENDCYMFVLDSLTEKAKEALA